MTATLQTLSLAPIQLPAGGRLRKELKKHRWTIRFENFMATIHKETEDRNPKAFGRGDE